MQKIACASLQCTDACITFSVKEVTLYTKNCIFIVDNDVAWSYMTYNLNETYVTY